MQKIDVSSLENFSLSKLSADEKKLLLQEMGYDTDGNYVLNDQEEQIFDKYISLPIRLDNMVVLPGSTIILDDNEVSIAMYLQEYGNDSEWNNFW